VTVGGRLVQPGTPAAIGNLNKRTRALEQASHGHLIYVGTYPTDPNTSSESPPFQNGWGNIGGDYPPLAFCLTAAGFVEFEGTCDGGTDGSVVFTLPEGYRPDQSQRFVAALSAGSDFMTLQVDPTGDVTVVARGFDPGVGGFDPTKISTAGATPGQVLTDVGGVATWADPASGVAATTEIEMAGTVIGSRGTLNFTGDGVATVSGADDAPDDRVNIQVGISASDTDGQVLTTVGGVAVWEDPSMPPSPPAVYPTIQVSGVAVGSEPTINFVEENVVSIVGIDNTGTDIEIDIGLAPGADGQVLQTVAGVPTWSDFTVPRILKVELFGALPASPGATQALFVPYVDGVSHTFDLQRIYARVETPGASGTVLSIQKSPSGGPFVGTDIGDATIPGGANDVTVTSSLGTVDSGDLVRVNFSALGAGAASFYVEFEAIEEV
jgi:hypothetical protein